MTGFMARAAFQLGEDSRRMVCHHSVQEASDPHYDPHAKRRAIGW